MSEPLDIRLVVQISASELERIKDHQHGQRMNGRSEAVRDILAAGFASLGLVTDDAPETVELSDDRDAPTIPEPGECGKPVMGEVILPWLRSQGRRVYTMGDVLEGVFKEQPHNHALGRDRVVINCFKAIGWGNVADRSAGKGARKFIAPDA
ncbi:MAG TPA: hypothetical protein VF638_12990 [Sphingomonas sp.]|jgi:hypothetical protein